MLDSIQRLLRVPELKKRIFFTLLMLVLCRFIGFIPVPGVNADYALSIFRQATGGSANLFQLVDIFSGGAFSKMTISALSVVPYISASIIMQLLIALLPSLQRELKEMPELGKKKVGRWIRMLTLALAILQSYLYAKHALHLNVQYPGVIYSGFLQSSFLGHIAFYLVATISMTSATLMLMWIGEQISDKGIGNGLSLIISTGIISSIPSAVGTIIQQMNLDSQASGEMNLVALIFLVMIFVFVILTTILIVQGQRKIPLEYARRVVGRQETQGRGQAYIPLKVNYAGVIPVIFASSLLLFPATIGQFLPSDNWIAKITSLVIPDTWTHTILFVLLILFFTYFWTATQFHPDQIASEMKKGGAFIPGIKQGKPTQDFLEQSMQRITLIGAFSLAFIAVLPTLIGKVLHIDPNIRSFFGGTPLLILVGVILDTMQQIDSHLIMNQYDGYIKKPRIR
jgi:preprotein translocase subunit SecY